ncbi:MAG: toll/interleukin-1 receptor domain-containing protein, partial [Blastocatellia bacterium]
PHSTLGCILSPAPQADDPLSFSLPYSTTALKITAPRNAVRSAVFIRTTTMSKKVFISYCHKQSDWVTNQLVPCLRAGGAEVLIDIERFRAGRAVIGQMDSLQDQADVTALISSSRVAPSRNLCRSAIRCRR